MATFLRRGGALLRQRSSLMGSVPSLSAGSAHPSAAFVAEDAVECVHPAARQP